MAGRRIVILGAGPAGTAAAAAARRTDPRTHVVMIEREAVAGALITQVPDALVEERGHAALRDVDGSRPDLLSVPPAAYWEEQGIVLRTGHHAVDLDPVRREVRVRDPAGELYAEPYDAVVVATGSSPSVPDVPGVDLEGVFALRRPVDAVPLEAHLAKEGVRRAVIVGAGIPGLALAEALLRRGLEVAVVEKAGRTLLGFRPLLAARIERALERHGGRLLCDQALERIERAGASLRVGTRSETLDTDVVVLATGARPDVELAARAGTDLGLSGAIRVEETQHAGIPDVYAAGECAETFHPLLRRAVYLPHPVAAFRQGLVAGANAAGGAKTYRGTVGTRSLRFFDLAIARTGLGSFDLADEGLAVFEATWRRPRELRAPDVELISLVVQKESGQLLGAEMLGTSAVLHRIDVMATAVYARLDVDAVAGLDLALAPPYSESEDPIRLAAEQAFEDLERSLGRGEIVDTGARPRRSGSFDVEV